MDLLESLNLKLNEIYGEPPSTIYHYTGANGLKGLLENHELWATKVDYLNDPIEEKYGWEIITNVLTEEADKIEEFETKKFIQNIVQNIKDKTFVFATNYFLASFSGKPDDLSQWIAYGHNGWGYCMGLSVGKEGINKEKLLPVIYKKNEQIEAVKELLNLAVQFIKKNGRSINAVNAAYMNFVPALKLLSICFKQEAYAHEEEWRLVFEPNKESVQKLIEFREGKNQTITPYISIKPLGDNGHLEKLPLKTIVLGPQRDDVDISIKLLLEINNYGKDIDIARSKIRFKS